MNGPIAQAVALVCHGNAALRGAPVPRFFPDNSTCQFCDRVEFVELGGSAPGEAGERVVAATPDEWFERLKAGGVVALRLGHGSSEGDPPLCDRLTAGFVGGGGQWSIATVADRRRSIWAARWEVWNQQAPQQRIWRVTYGRVGEVAPVKPASPPALDRSASRLRDVLGELVPFARRNDCGGFADCFAAALHTLETGARPNVYHRDLAPRGGLPPEAECLLTACQQGWVFGGMGSWNDLGFEGPEQAVYERLSEALFGAVNAALVAAANASCAG